jgi:hypothetical protein
MEYADLVDAGLTGRDSMLVSACESSCALKLRPREWQSTRALSPLNLRRPQSSAQKNPICQALPWKFREPMVFSKQRSVAVAMNYQTRHLVRKWLIHYVLILERLLLVVGC